MSDRILLGTRKGVFIFHRESGQWTIKQRAFLGDHANIVCHDPRDGSLYASLYHGHFGTKVHRSTDEGQTWTEIACPTYPEKPDDVDEPPNPFSGKATPWSLQKIWSLECSPHAPDGEIWCGTIPGGLFHSSDHGESWEFVRTLWDNPARQQWMGGGEDYAGIHSILVDPRNPNHVTIGVSIGGVWTTPDKGQTWQVLGKGLVADYMPPEQSEEPSAQDPHLMVQAECNPDCLWIQHHNGVFRSRDGGHNWDRIEDITPSTFGFPVAVHPHDPNTAWLVPAIKDEKRIPVDGRVVVTRTRDGGDSWEQLSDGLPGEDAYDLVFRHALAIDSTGDRLAFGSTTGSVWVSENQGDSWQELTSHLPPIYCVKFF